MSEAIKSGVQASATSHTPAQAPAPQELGTINPTQLNAGTSGGGNQAVSGTSSFGGTVTLNRSVVGLVRKDAATDVVQHLNDNFKELTKDSKPRFQFSTEATGSRTQISVQTTDGSSISRAEIDSIRAFVRNA